LHSLNGAQKNLNPALHGDWIRFVENGTLIFEYTEKPEDRLVTFSGN